MSKLIKKYRLLSVASALAFGIVCLLIFSSFRPLRANPFGVNRVVIDAGHGGHDSGCLGQNTKEKDVALGISLKLGKYIEENFPDVKVIYTRKTDQFVELFERASIANNAHADLFICVHCNSACFIDKKRHEVCNTETAGVETWVMGLHKSEANLAVAKRENEVVLMEKDYAKKYDGFDPNSPEANIIFSLYQNSFLDQSLKMASFVQQEVKGKARSVRGVKQAGFLVLYKTSMPSILIETGFLSNPDEERFLSSESGQDKMASAIFRAFRSYKRSVDGAKSSVDFGVTKNEDDSSEKEVTKAPNEVGPSTDKKEDSIYQPSKKNNNKDSGTSDSDVIWGVQFYNSAVRIPNDNAKFKGLKNIRVDFEKKAYKYSTGKLKNMDEATALQTKLRNMGFKDAFVVAFYKDKKITSKEALSLQKKADIR